MESFTLGKDKMLYKDEEGVCITLSFHIKSAKKYGRLLSFHQTLLRYT